MHNKMVNERVACFPLDALRKSNESAQRPGSGGPRVVVITDLLPIHSDALHATLDEWFMYLLSRDPTFTPRKLKRFHALHRKREFDENSKSNLANLQIKSYP